MLDHVVTLLEARALEFEQTEDDTITSGFTVSLDDGTDHGFPLFIMAIEDGYGDAYIRFTIVPFIEQSYVGYPGDLYVMVGQINHDLPQLKFAFDDDGDLELLFDVPADKLDDAEFDRALQALADYAGAYYPELASVVEST